MATRVQVFPVTVPAQTLQAAPATTALSFPPGRVDNLEIVVPPGPSGLVGFQVLHSGTPVLPADGNTYIVTDNEVIDWPLERFPTGNRWSLRAYNTDRYAHTIYMRFLVTDVQPVEPVGIAPIPIPITSATLDELAEAELLPEPDDLDALPPELEDATP